MHCPLSTKRDQTSQLSPVKGKDDIVMALFMRPVTLRNGLSARLSSAIAHMIQSAKGEEFLSHA